MSTSNRRASRGTGTPRKDGGDRRRQAMDARLKARRDGVARARLRRRRRVTASVAALVLVAMAATGVAMSPLAEITEVRVMGVDGERLRQARAAADVHLGENVLAADLGAAEGRIEELPWVHSAAVRRQPPTTVEVTVVVRTPVARVATSESTWLVDREGVVVAEGSDKQLPLVEAPEAVLPAVGDPVRDAAVRNALKMRARLPDRLRSQVVRYEAPSPRGLRLQLDNAVTVRVGRAERVEEKAQAMALMLAQMRDAEEDGGGSGAPGSGRGGASRFADPGESRDDAAGSDGARVAEIDVRAPDRPVLVPGGGTAP